MTEPQDHQPLPLNQLLADARERMGMTLDVAAQRLNLTEAQLANFEQNAIDVRALSPFERGYLRNYAVLLELDSDLYEPLFPHAEEIGSELQSMRRYQYDAPTPLIKSGFMRFMTSLLLLALLGVLVGWLWLAF